MDAEIEITLASSFLGMQMVHSQHLREIRITALLQLGPGIQRISEISLAQDNAYIKNINAASRVTTSL